MSEGGSNLGGQLCVLGIADDRAEQDRRKNIQWRGRQREGKRAVAENIIGRTPLP